MKRLLLGIFICFVLFSCEKETILIIDQTSLSFPDSGGSQTITLTVNKPWTVISDQTWCKISPSGGEEASSMRITITCDTNTSFDARNCEITFTCAELSQTISISQDTNNGLLVSQTSFELTKNAQQLEIDIRANVKFSVEIDSACIDWVKYNSTKGLSISTLVLDIAENTTYDNRQGTVLIKQEDGPLFSTVHIRQSQTDGLFVYDTDHIISSDGGIIDFGVVSNVDYEIIIPDSASDWIAQIYETKALIENRVLLSIGANPTYVNRFADLLIC